MRKLTINFIMGPFLPIPPIKGGGVEVYLYNIAGELSKRHKVRIYSRRYRPLKNRDRINNLEIIRLGGFRKTRSRILELLEEALFAFYMFFNAKKADVTHFLNLKSFLLFLFNPRKGKSIVHLQVPFGGMTSKFLRFADLLVPNSDYTMNYFKKRANIKNGKMVTVPNGVDIKQFKRGEDNDKVKRRYNLTDNKIVGYVGRISREKGVQYLIDAFKIVRDKRDDVKLLLIGPYLDSEYGDFIYYSDLVSKIKDYHIEDDVMFTGVITHEDLPPYYNACDILSFPSDWEEPFGIVSIEALACGKPVIVTDSGAFREIIRDGRNGFIVPKKDPHAIAEKIMLLLDDETLRKNLSQAAAESAKFYSFESIAKRYEELYERLI